MHVSTTPAVELAQYLAEQFAARADEADKRGSGPVRLSIGPKYIPGL